MSAMCRYAAGDYCEDTRGQTTKLPLRSGEPNTSQRHASQFNSKNLEGPRLTGTRWCRAIWTMAASGHRYRHRLLLVRSESFNL